MRQRSMFAFQWNANADKGLCAVPGPRVPAFVPGTAGM